MGGGASKKAAEGKGGGPKDKYAPTKDSGAEPQAPARPRVTMAGTRSLDQGPTSPMDRNESVRTEVSTMGRAMSKERSSSKGSKEGPGSEGRAGSKQPMDQARGPSKQSLGTSRSQDRTASRAAEDARELHQRLSAQQMPGMGNNTPDMQKTLEQARTLHRMKTGQELDDVQAFDDRSGSKQRSGSKRKTTRNLSTEVSDDTRCRMFKIGDRVMPVGKQGLERGMGTIVGCTSFGATKLLVKYDSGSEGEMKGEKLKYIDEQSEKMMKGMNPIALARFLGDGLEADDCLSPV